MKHAAKTVNTAPPSAPTRDRRGLFVKGHSGNPLGRPRESYRISDLAKSHTESMLATLVAIAEDPDAPPAARVSAAEAVLSRAHGRPVQSQELKIETADFSAMHLQALRELAGISSHEEHAPVIDVTPAVAEN